MIPSDMIERTTRYAHHITRATKRLGSRENKYGEYVSRTYRPALKLETARYDQHTNMRTRSTIEVRSTYPLKMFSEWRGSLTQNCRNANLVPKNDVIVYLGHGIIHRDAV